MTVHLLKEQKSATEIVAKCGVTINPKRAVKNGRREEEISAWSQDVTCDECNGRTT